MSLYWSNPSLEVHRLVVGPLDNNVFFIRDTKAEDALMIDAANEPDRLLNACKELSVSRVIQTHGHWDHVQAVEEVRGAGMPVAVSPQDAPMLPSYDSFIKDGDVVEVGEWQIRVIATPGHTPGSLCFYVEGTPLLFTGDTLFPGGPGNTSFPGGDFQTIVQSINDRIVSAFDDGAIILPGHGEDTTIGQERWWLDPMIADNY